jgi:hypothetical protein
MPDKACCIRTANKDLYDLLVTMGEAAGIEADAEDAEDDAGRKGEDSNEDSAQE